MSAENILSIIGVNNLSDHYSLVRYINTEGKCDERELKAFQVRLIFEIYEQIKELKNEVKKLKDENRELKDNIDYLVAEKNFKENAKKLKTFDENKLDNITSLE